VRHLAVIAFVAAAACSSSGSSNDGPPDAQPPPPPPGDDAGGGDDASSDAGSEDAGPRTITITTRTPSTTTAAGGKASAPWAAMNEGNGAWRALTPASAGTYTFVTSEARWAVAFACADDAASASTVEVHELASSTTTLDLVLDTDCAAAPAPSHTISGTLSNFPAATSWLDFGYALDTRGSVQAGPDYEVVNVVDGTWDLFFGVRDDSFGPLTKVIVKRAQTLSADTTLDLDLGGAGSFAPGKSDLVIRGVAADDGLEPTITYGGLTVGPQNAPATSPEVHTQYDTIAAAAQVASDKYRVAIAATRNAGDDVRAIEASFHAAVAIDVTLPAALAAPTVAVAGDTRLATTITPRATAATYEATTEVATTPRAHRRWRGTIAASLGATITQPDLSSVPGFMTAWALPKGSVTVTASVRENATSLGDGTAQGVSSKRITFTP
jgi:hypothetical protein